MAELKITTRAPKKEKEMTVGYDFGDTLADAIAKFGEEVVFSNFKQSAVISLQGNVRRYMEQGKLTDEEIEKKVGEWKPQIAKVSTTDATEAILKKAAKMSEKERAELIEKLMAAGS